MVRASIFYRLCYIASPPIAYDLCFFCAHHLPTGGVTTPTPKKPTTSPVCQLDIATPTTPYTTLTVV